MNDTSPQRDPRPCVKAGCGKDATVIMANGDTEYEFCEHHGAVAAAEHDYSFVQRINLA